MRIAASIVALLLAALLFAACQPFIREVSVPPPGVMPALPEAGAQIYRLDSERSVVSLKVYREGALARFGHNHVIAMPHISGTVFRQPELWRSGARLLLPVRDMVVDRATDRRAAGDDFAGRISASAIDGTRRNMLSPELLDGANHPLIEIRVAGIRGRPPQVTLVARVKVKNVVSALEIPAHLELGDHRIKVWGSVSLSHRQLGLTPFSVMGGNLRVRDAIDVDFYLVAER